MKERTTALVLAGGRGTRMGILTEVRPKPALPFAGTRRVIDFSLSNLHHSGIKDISILVDYRREVLIDYLAQWQKLNRLRLNILPPQAGSYAGTADAVYQNLEFLEERKTENALILAADHVYRMDYRPMLEFHEAVRADVTVGVVRIPAEETHRFGTVTTDAAGRVTDFKEKSSMALSNLASMGIYVFKYRELARLLHEDAAAAGSLHDFGYNILPRIVREGRVFAYEFAGYWHDIGSIDAYYRANMDFLTPQPYLSPRKDFPILSTAGASTSPRFSHGANVVNSLVSPGCVIAGSVENSVLSEGVYVAEKAVVRNSVVMAGASIGHHSIISGCILDEATDIGDFCYVGFGNSSPKDAAITVLGRGVTVPDRIAIGSRCLIRPGLGRDAFLRGTIPSGTLVTS